MYLPQHYFCISGELILFATGIGEDHWSTNLAQVYNISAEKCSSLAPFPSSTRFATGGLVDKTPVLCGGRVDNRATSKCYYHDRNSNSWMVIGNMSTVRDGAASIVINSKLWVMGGSASDGSGGYPTHTEFIDMKNGGEIISGPPLKEWRSHYCAVALNVNEVMIIGAATSYLYRKTEIYNTITGDWRDGPTLNVDRTMSACALFQSSLHNNRKVVLVAGGSRTNTAEILDYSLENAQWALSK